MVQNQLFSYDPLYRKRDWKSFAFSYVLQAIAVAVLVKMAVMPSVHFMRQVHTTLYTPMVVKSEPIKTPPRPQPRLQSPPKMQLAKLAPPQPKLEIPKPVEPPKVVAELKPVPLPEVKPQPVKAPPKVELGKFEEKPAPVMPPGNPNKPLEVGAFSGSSAPATVKAPPQKVQTGGFGDPNGVPANANARDATLVAAKLGSFDLPQGDGNGNGTGGSKGIKGTVASAGFGGGVAGPGEGDHNGGGRHSIVQATTFGDMQAAPSEPRVRRTAAVSPTTPVEILAKPTPVYTDEAKKLRIEGEVLVQVVFTAGGNVRVLRVVRGLGHGLDEAAISAAERIRYKPAQRDGQPVDSNATLHIVFQLA